MTVREGATDSGLAEAEAPCANRHANGRGRQLEGGPVSDFMVAELTSGKSRPFCSGAWLQARLPASS